MADNKVTYRIPSGKKSYTISYRHPIVKDFNQNGKKIQRGTGTGDEGKAKQLCEQLQELVSNERWHKGSMRTEAATKFDPIVVAAFYDCMPDAHYINNALNSIAPVGLKDGYPVVAIVGSTGAGKTTLLRVLLGTIKEAFPTTSANRTTTCEMEVIRKNKKDYEIAVEFISRVEIEAVLLDNISNAIKYIMIEAKETSFIDDTELLTTTLNHQDLQTRLTYTLGLPTLQSNEEEEEDEEEEERAEETDLDEIAIKEIDYDVQNRILQEIKKSITDIGIRYRDSGKSFEEISEEIHDDEDVLTLIDEIIHVLLGKFALLEKGKKTNPKAEWPDGWYFSTTDRKEFFQFAKIFTSDDYRLYGRLLTPLVKAIRISGPFIAEGDTIVNPMVLSDGVGLGHATKSFGIPVASMDRCLKSDAIVFVERGDDPMAGTTRMALKTLIEYGYADKVIFAFTKMDLLVGGSYRGNADRKRHIKTALKGYLENMKKQEEHMLSDLEASTLVENSVFFSHLPNHGLSKMTVQSLSALDQKIINIVQKQISTDDVKLKYEALKLYYYFKEAVFEFRKEWGEIIGYSGKTDRTEHWSRIKALSRRLGMLEQESYDYLAPLSSFAYRVQSKINLFINNPDSITPGQTSEEVVDEQKRIIKDAIGRSFRELNKERMWKNKKTYLEWGQAYIEAGQGSTIRRARRIEQIFDEAAPYLADIPNLAENQKEYLASMIQLVDSVLKENGCEMLRFNL